MPEAASGGLLTGASASVRLPWSSFAEVAFDSVAGAGAMALGAKLSLSSSLAVTIAGGRADWLPVCEGMAELGVLGSMPDETSRGGKLS